MSAHKQLMVQQALFPGRLAEFSDCGRYRYTLHRPQRGEGPHVCFVLLNPSTADDERNDPTVRRCLGFAKKRYDACAITVLHAFAFRTPSPFELYGAHARGIDVVGPDNDWYIDRILTWQSPVVIGGWGSNGHARWARPRIEKLMAKLRQGRDVFCLGKTKTGQPRHPLYVPYEQNVEVL